MHFIGEHIEREKGGGRDRKREGQTVRHRYGEAARQTDRHVNGQRQKTIPHNYSKFLFKSKAQYVITEMTAPYSLIIQ